MHEQWFLSRQVNPCEVIVHVQEKKKNLKNIKRGRRIQLNPNTHTHTHIYIYNITFRLSMTRLLSYCPLISAFQIYYIIIWRNWKNFHKIWTYKLCGIALSILVNRQNILDLHGLTFFKWAISLIKIFLSTHSNTNITPQSTQSITAT